MRGRHRPAAAPATFALRLHSHRLAAGLTRVELERAAQLGTGRAKDLEDGAAKATRRHAGQAAGDAAGAGPGAVLAMKGMTYRHCSRSPAVAFFP
jgi:hypothetical protein